jgi:hypothetical protein
MTNTNGLAPQQPEYNISNHCTARACRRHRHPLDYEHPYDSMQRYAKLLALKYQKMKGNEPFSEKALSRG